MLVTQPGVQWFCGCWRHSVQLCVALLKVAALSSAVQFQNFGCRKLTALLLLPAVEWMCLLHAICSLMVTHRDTHAHAPMHTYIHMHTHTYVCTCMHRYLHRYIIIITCHFIFREWCCLYIWQEQICWQFAKQVLGEEWLCTTSGLWRWTYSSGDRWGIRVELEFHIVTYYQAEISDQLWLSLVLSLPLS